MTNDPQPTAAFAFHLLWESLSELIGTSATATLVRRAAKHAAARDPALSGLIITKPVFEYEYIVPKTWSSSGSEELKALLQALQPLLVELTGLIIVQRLRSISPLAEMLVEDDVES